MSTRHLSRRKTPKQKRAIDRETRILDYAEEAFHRGSYAKVSMASIARGAGVSQPSLYQHFASRDAVLLALLERRSRLIDAHSATMVAQLATNDWRVVLRTMVSAFYHLNRTRPSLDTIFIAAQTVPELREAERIHMRQRAEAGAMLTSALTGIPNGESLLMAQLAHSLVSASIIRHALTCDHETGERLVEEACAIIEARLVALGAN
jgi:AcrR family transcriptional regulator